MGAKAGLIAVVVLLSLRPVHAEDFGIPPEECAPYGLRFVWSRLFPKKPKTVSRSEQAKRSIEAIQWTGPPPLAVPLNRMVRHSDSNLLMAAQAVKGRVVNLFDYYGQVMRYPYEGRTLVLFLERGAGRDFGLLDRATVPTNPHEVGETRIWVEGERYPQVVPAISGTFAKMPVGAAQLDKIRWTVAELQKRGHRILRIDTVHVHPTEAIEFSDSAGKAMPPLYGRMSPSDVKHAQELKAAFPDLPVRSVIIVGGTKENLVRMIYYPD